MSVLTAPKLVLPTEVTPASKRWIDQRFLMLGQAGIGKSTFWANDPNALFVDTEGNLTHLAVKRLPVRSWGDMQEVGAMLFEQAAKTGVPFPYSTLVIDTLDRLLAYAEEYVVAHAKEKFSKMADSIDTIGDVPNGGGWADTTKLMVNCLTKLDQLPCALVMVAHVKQDKVEEPLQKYDKETVSLWKGVGAAVLGFSKHTLHLQAYYVGDTLKRFIIAMPSKGVEAKSHGGLVPNKLEWKTPKLQEEFTQFRGLFD